MNNTLKILLTMLLSFFVGLIFGFIAAKVSHKITARIRKKNEARRIDKMIRDTRNLIKSMSSEELQAETRRAERESRDSYIMGYQPKHDCVPTLPPRGSKGEDA